MANLLFVSFHLLLLVVLTTSLPWSKARPRCRCFLPSVWTASYKWSNEASGKLLVDHKRRLLVTEESLGGPFQYHLKLSEDGTDLRYGSSTNGRRHYVFDRPLNVIHDRCLTNGQPSRDGKSLRFDLVDSRSILVSSCSKQLRHTSSKMSLWLSKDDCQPTAMQFTSVFQDLATGRQLSAIPSRFLLTDVQRSHPNSRLSRVEPPANRC